MCYNDGPAGATEVLVLWSITITILFRDLRKTNVACTDIVAPAIESCNDEAMNIIKVLNFSF